MNDSCELVLDITKEQAAILNNGWDGNGVPPVGTYCGYARKNAYRVEAKCTILSMYPESDQLLVKFCQPGDQKPSVKLDAKLCNFYQIKSAEEHREESVKRAVGKMMEVIKAAGATTLFDQLAALYEAGYAKEKN